MKTVILGLGNPILRDDSAGIRVADELKHELDRPEVTVMDTSMGGLGLLELLVGYDRAIIIDAIQTVDGSAGQIYRISPEELDNTLHAASPHDVNFATALKIGNKVGLALPHQITIFAIEVADASTFSEECTPAVEQAIPTAVQMVMKELDYTSQSDVISGRGIA